MNDFLDRLKLGLPIVQAPMAGVSTPELAAAVSNAGALGSISVGASDVASARAAIAKLGGLARGPFNVNVFCHRPAHPDGLREAAWLEALRPIFASFDARPPENLREIYTSFATDRAMLAVLLDARPAMVSFHFGLPPDDVIAALKKAGCLLLATVTNLTEGKAAARAGVDVLVAQGTEAGGHRGVFDEHAPDDHLGIFALTRLLVRRLDLPIIAAGGIMDGAGIAAALDLGAVAVQMGTAFVGCPESSAKDAHRAALFGPDAAHTMMTTAISGRPARCLANRFTALGTDLAGLPRPDYPIAYDAGKALNAAASARGEGGFGAHWAGQGALLARAMPAGELVRTLQTELEDALRHRH